MQNKPKTLKNNFFIVNDIVSFNAVKHCDFEIDSLQKERNFNKNQYFSQFNSTFLKSYQTRGAFRFNLI